MKAEGRRVRSVKLGAAALAAALVLSGCVRVIPEAHPPGTPAPQHRPAPHASAKPTPHTTARPTPRPAPRPTAQPYRPTPHPQPTPVPTSAPTPTVPSANAAGLGVVAGPDFASLGINDVNARAPLLSLRESCPKLVGRTDMSGLTRPADWQMVCAAAANWSDDQAAGFFAKYFETAVVGDGRAYVTGYYEPEIAGVRKHQRGYDVPVYAQPADLVHAKPGDAPLKPNGQPPFGRYDANGKFQPYYDRTQIENGALKGKGLEIAWAADPVEFFFLQVQGSGRLRAPDGSIIRIGYIADNGVPYINIGAAMRDRGLIGNGPGQYPGSMQGIMQFLREHPEEGHALLQLNRSWVFFRELTGDAPLGALGVPVRANVSLAVDPLFIPLGAPVVLQTGRDVLGGLWLAQDTGGGIKGANRVDSFWGAGDDARQIAGTMATRGQAVILLPRGAVARLSQR